MISSATCVKSSGMKLIRSRSSESLSLPQKITLSEWCEKNVRLSPQWEATPGHYNLKDNPFWREPLDSLLDPATRQISVLKSTQVGGTLLLIAATLGISELDPAPAMIVGPDELYAKELSDRTYATAEESPRFFRCSLRSESET